MAAATDLIEDWGDGTYRFALPIKQLEELDDKCAAGPLTVLKRLLDGSWRVVDVRETIRLGLIGGGLDAVAALKLVRLYVDGLPLERAVPIAALILVTALRGRKIKAEDDAGNATAATPATDPVKTGSASLP
ncbi:gene transfer agent family protein [Lichenihabitans psoromatis]|uniref:gene transfer agent family protein n=1 Tax=Lichenihabitans psoromatis TaxID=2528642 RepID=UPI001038569A|nr:gene transfer agent family protein [Lichenihabitans psoromatis]